LGVLAAAPLAMVLAGCSAEGTGTISGKAKDAQTKSAEGEASIKPKTAKQAKALESQQEAAKKNPKLY
jgi:hypothetical protein